MARNILILSLTRMGDLIQTTPLIQGLKDKHRNARITLMVSSDFEDAVSLIPGVDDSIVFNLRQFKDSNEWEDESWVKIYRYIESKLNGIRNKDFDLLVNLSHSRFSALMVHYLKVKNVIGFYCNATGDRMTGHPWMQYFGTEPFNRNFNEFNLVEIFSRSAGIDMTGREIQVLENRTDICSDEGVPSDFPKSDDALIIGFQIGSSLENRRWSTASFAKLADLLVEKLNARILIFGVASESKSAKEMIQLTKNKDQVTDLTGKTDLKQLSSLLKDCDYLVTNDTGTMHLAAALNTKIIGLFFAHAHPFETAPFSSGHLVFQARISCAPCSYGVHCSNVVCVEKVLPEHILTFVENHIEHKVWKLPSDLINASELNVYETVTSAQGLIRLKPVIRHDLELEDVFRLAYSVLWRETLVVGTSANLNSLQELLEDYKNSDSRTIEELLKNKTELLEAIEALGKEGARLCDGIVKSATYALSVKLVRFGEDIQKIDEKIELTGMAHPELKPITDMFTKRKENLMGSDISRLGIESRKCYTLLRNESRRMIEILTAEHVGVPYSTHKSIRVAVPGR
ncbi:glycosyltransferase family 9 protein [Nitrospina gracilis]|nr:glycosyltransferase family 9 protein [Nitrospina gracilis]